MFVVGSAKAGTTTISDVMAQHPKIVFSQPKEPNHFNKPDWRSNAERYLNNFSLRVKTEHRLFAEGSVAYLKSTTAANAIYELNPEAKIIISLRNPVDRLLSLYAMYSRLNGLDNPSLLNKHSWLFNQVLVAEAIERYKNLFGKNCLLLVYEQWTKDISFLNRELAGFLNLDSTQFPIELPNSNKGGVPKYPRLDNNLKPLRQIIKKTTSRVVQFQADRVYKKLFFAPYRYPTVNRDELWIAFKQEIDELQRVSDLALHPYWKSNGQGKP